VDYALCATPPKKDVFIEVKALGQSIGADKQLFEYAYVEGIPFAILTDGREWNFYVPGEQGSYDERRVQKLDIVERSPADVIETFRKYLECKRVRSGDALNAARADYQNISKRKVAQKKIPTAWAELVSEPDDLLLDLIAEKAEALCGFRPAPEDIEEFLITDLRVIPSAASQALPQTSPKKTQVPVLEQPPASERAISYKIFGEARHADNAIEALIDILRTLAKRNPSFIETIAPLVKGRHLRGLLRPRHERPHSRCAA
jgi:predicted type IV restriction endonuclease